MITETVPTRPPIEGGKKINTYLYNLRSFRMNKMMEASAFMCLGLLECQSNNTSNSVSARDARNFQKAVADIEREWKWAKDKRDDPTGTHELVFTLQFPQPAEIQVMPNAKLRSVAWELYNFFHVALGTQDANQGVWVGAESEEDVDAAFKTLEEIVKTMIGNGKKSNGAFDVGVSVANYKFVGMVRPPMASPQVALQEASSDVQPPRVPDAPDVDGGPGGSGNTTETNPSTFGASS